MDVAPGTYVAFAGLFHSANAGGRAHQSQEHHAQGIGSTGPDSPLNQLVVISVSGSCSGLRGPFMWCQSFTLVGDDARPGLSWLPPHCPLQIWEPAAWPAARPRLKGSSSPMHA